MDATNVYFGDQYRGDSYVPKDASGSAKLITAGGVSGTAFDRQFAADPAGGVEAVEVVDHPCFSAQRALADETDQLRRAATRLGGQALRRKA